MSELDTLEHNIVRHLVSACLNHNDLLLCTCNGYEHFALFALLNGRVNNILAVHKTEPYACDRAVPGNVGN